MVAMPHASAPLYNKHKGGDGVDNTVELTLEPSCCGVETSANYVAGVHFTTDTDHISTRIPMISALVVDPFG